MPVTHIVQSVGVAFQDLGLLSAAVETIRSARPSVRSARTGRFFDNDAPAVESREELSAGLTLIPTALSMAAEMLNHPIGKDEHLAGRSNWVMDHAAGATSNPSYAVRSRASRRRNSRRVRGP